MSAVSTFTWLDHRDDDQQRVRDALAALDQPGIVDPLGFGTVRDAFSDMMFPGISTVQTRARYFLFVPWVYRRLDRRRVSPADGAARARSWELAIIEALLTGSDEHEGIIGRNSRGATRQLPSVIYWSGLANFNIRRFDGSRHEYVATLQQRRHAGSSLERQLWPDLPEEPDSLLESTTLALTPGESEFLRDRMVMAAAGTYLELLLRDGTADQTADSPWLHPLSADAPKTLRIQLHHARLLSAAARGAELLYNRELSRLLEEDGRAPLETDYDALLAAWTDQIGRLEVELASWDRDELWRLVATQNPRAAVSRGFVDWWLQLVSGSPGSVATSLDVQRRLREREAAIKGARAKLANRGARERSPGAQGGSPMRFRWPQAQQIITDVHVGLAGRA